MSEQPMPSTWYSPSELDWFGRLRVSRHYLSLSSPTVRSDLPADAYRLVPAVIDEAALARAADEVHAEVRRRGGVKFDSYLEFTALAIEAYLRALGAGSGE